MTWTIQSSLYDSNQLTNQHNGRRRTCIVGMRARSRNVKVSFRHVSRGPNTYAPECLRSRSGVCGTERGKVVNYGRRGRQATGEMWQRVSLSTDLGCSKWWSCICLRSSSHSPTRARRIGTSDRGSVRNTAGEECARFAQLNGDIGDGNNDDDGQ